MNIPSIPTDNLYKFMAIFGLVIVSFGFYILTKGTSDYIESKKGFASADFKYFQDSVRYEHKRNLYDSLIEELNEDMRTGNMSSEYYVQRIQDIKPILDEVLDLDDAVMISLHERVKKRFNMEAIDNFRDKYFIFNIALLSLGTILIYYGFSKWYFKYQRYIDAEVKCKGEVFVEQVKAEKERQQSQQSMDEGAKQKVIQYELNKNKDKADNESDTTNPEPS